MNNFLQLTLNMFVLLYGMFFLIPFHRKINYLTYLALSWFVGWGIIGNIEIFLVIFGLNATLLLIILAACILLLVFTLMTLLLYKDALTIKSYLEYFSHKKTLRCFALSVGIFIYFTYIANYVYFTTDILVGDALSRLFHGFGVCTENRRLLYILLNQRLPLYISIQSIAHLTGIERYSSFSGATVFFLCLAICGFWKQSRDSFSKSEKIWLCLVLGLLFSNCLIRTHIFTPLSNIITMGYYSTGILCLHGYSRKQDSFMFVIACFLMGCTCIIRKEMLLFALIPFMILAWQNLLPNLKISISGLFAYTLPAFSWQIWGISKIWRPALITKGVKTSSHGGQLIVLILLLVTILIFVLAKMILRKKLIKNLVTAGIVIGLIIFTLYNREKMVHSANQLLFLMFNKKIRWGIFWALPVLGIVIYSIIYLLNKLNIHTFSELNFEKIMNNYGLNFNYFLFIIVIFMFFRITLYSVFPAPKDTDFWASGNRILIHIYPVIIFFLGKLGYVLGDMVCDRKMLNH